jgi:hypothetical protein
MVIRSSSSQWRRMATLVNLPYVEVYPNHGEMLMTSLRGIMMLLKQATGLALYKARLRSL